MRSVREQAERERIGYASRQLTTHITGNQDSPPAKSAGTEQANDYDKPKQDTRLARNTTKLE